MLTHSFFQRKHKKLLVIWSETLSSSIAPTFLFVSFLLQCNYCEFVANRFRYLNKWTEQRRIQIVREKKRDIYLQRDEPAIFYTNGIYQFQCLNFMWAKDCFNNNSFWVFSCSKMFNIISIWILLCWTLNCTNPMQLFVTIRMLNAN